MDGCADILRRRFVAIATGRFEASGVFPSLDVAAEVTELREGFCAPAFAERGFRPDFEELAADPSEDVIKRDLVTDTRFGDGDAVVLYVTGHGVTDKGRHRTVLRASDPDRLAQTALDTVTLLEWLAEHRDLEHVLLIIDLCNAGDVQAEITREMRAAIPDSWIALLTTSVGATAKVGAFTGAVAHVLEEIRTGPQRDASDIEPYLESHVFVARVRALLKSQHGQDLQVLHDPYETSCCLPNPRYDPAAGDRVATTSARSDLAILEQDMAAHWGRKAQVGTSDTPWVFTGRRRLMERLISTTTGPPHTVVVTGRAGSGKSAVLARLVTCSDPAFRARYADQLTQMDPVPPEDAVDVAILATGKGPEQVVARLAGAVGADVASAPGDITLDPWLDGIARALSGRDTITLVVDALDESTDPVGIVRTVLHRLNPPGQPQMRLIIGVRSVSEDAADGRRAHDLAHTTVEALDSAVIAVDGDEYWEDRDLHTFVTQGLTQPTSPYARDPSRAWTVTKKIADGSQRSFLLAKLVTEAFASREQQVEPGDPELTRILAGGVTEAIRSDLIASLPDPAQQMRAVLLLRAVALAFGRGMPWRDVWPVAASAIAPDGQVLGDADVAWLLAGRMAGYLVRDIEDDVTVYRLIHDALRESLARDIERFVGDGVHHPDETAAHRRIALALLPPFDPHRAQPPRAYARRHLAEHAAAAGALDEPFLTAETLPLLDAAVLSRSLRLVQAEPHSRLGELLGAWRGVRHRWSWDSPHANAAALDMALTAAGAGQPERVQHSGVAWRPRWAEWSFGGTVIGVEEARGLQSIAFDQVAGRRCLVTGGAMEMRVWDAATSEPLGPPLVGAKARAVVVATVGGLATVVGGGYDRVTAWDPITGQQRWTREVGGSVYALAVGAVHGRTAIAVGSTDAPVRLLDAETGDDSERPLGVRAPVRGLAVGMTPDRRQRLAVGRGDGVVEQWDLDAFEPAAAPIDVAAEVNDVAFGIHDRRLYLATGDSDGRALLWDASMGVPAGEACRHGDEVRSVSLVDAAGQLLLATGGFDDRAIVWDPFSGRPSTDAFPHSDSVLDVAFGFADGRLMLATACADGNARLWDPVRPSAARVASSGRVQSLAMAATGRGVLLAGPVEKGAVRVWRAEDGAELAELPSPTSPQPGYKMAGWPPVDVAVADVGGRVVVAAAVSGMARAWDLDQPGRFEEFTWNPGARAVGPEPVAIAVHDTRVLVAYATASLAEHDISDGSSVHVARDLTGRRTLFRVTGRWPIRSLAFLKAATGDPVLAVMTGERVELLDGLTGSRRWPAVHAETGAVALHRIGDANVLAFWRPDGIGLWNLTSGEAYGPGVQRPGSYAQNGLALTRVGGRDLLLSAHFATVRGWNPRTGRLVTELPFGTSIDAMAVTSTAQETLVAISGPGVLVTTLDAGSAVER